MTHGKRFSWKVTMFGFALAAAATSAQAADLNAFFPERGEGTVALSYTTESYDQFWRAPPRP